jgi:hypothetical protein
MHHPACPTRQHHHRTRATRPTRIPIPHRRPARARVPVTVIAAPVAIAVIIPIIPPIAVTIMVMPTVIIPPITATIIARTIVTPVARTRTRPRRTIRTTRRRHIAGSQKQGRHQGQEEGGRFHDKGKTNNCHIIVQQAHFGLLSPPCIQKASSFPPAAQRPQPPSRPKNFSRFTRRTTPHVERESPQLSFDCIPSRPLFLPSTS